MFVTYLGVRDLLNISNRVSLGCVAVPTAAHIMWGPTLCIDIAAKCERYCSIRTNLRSNRLLFFFFIFHTHFLVLPKLKKANWFLLMLRLS